MPSLRERLPAWLGGRRSPQREAVEPIEFHPMYTQYYGQGLTNQPSQAMLLQENIGVPDFATRAIANRVASLNPLVKVKRSLMDGTEEVEILDDHVLKVLLDNPHPDFSTAMLLGLVGYWIPTNGRAAFLKVRNGLNVPFELHPIPPSKIEPRWEMGIIRDFLVMDRNGRQIPIPRDAILYVFRPDPEYPWGSEGYLGPVGIQADSSKFAAQHLRSHYQNDATPPTYLKAGEGAQIWGPEEKKRFYAEWRQRYHNRMGSERGMPALVPFGYDLGELQRQTGADIVPLLDFWEKQLLKAFGVPRSILGEVVSGDRSSAETNQYVFDLHTVMPIVRLIEDAFTGQLARDFDPMLFVEFESFVSEDKEFALEKQTADLRDKVRSINMVREEDGLDPVPWGEEPVGKIGEMPYDPDLSYEMANESTEAIDTGMENDDGAAQENEEERTQEARSRDLDLKRVSSYFAPESEWQRQLARERKYVPSFEVAMLSVFREQKRDVMKRFGKLVNRQRETGKRITSFELFDPDDHRWRRLFKKRVEPIRRASFLEIIAETLEGFGIQEFHLTKAINEILDRQGAQLVQHANRTTQRAISSALQKATDEGESIDQMAKRIRGVFTTRRKHARTIARTEILKASEQSQLLGFETSGVVERKQWNDSRDAGVRHSHQIDGQQRALREPFQLADGELADAPGVGAYGGQLSAGNAINCRCFVTPVLEK
jgi:hypothetical protein